MTAAPETLFARLRKLNLGGAPQAPVTVPRTASRLPGRIVTLPGGDVHVAESVVPRDLTHGRVALDAREAERALAAAAAARDPRFRDIDPACWLFIDTETTSLNSGAGVWVFMVGIGAFDAGGFRVRQFLLVDPGAEAALLAAVHDLIAAAPAVVSFHGKSFDAPRLDDRFRLAGFDPVFAGKPHLDLLHPMRRLVGDRLPDCRLRTIEESILGMRRVDDLPGALCPDAYFSYLRGRPHRLGDVFEHNRLDVMSLSAVAGYLPKAYGAQCRSASPLRAGLDWAAAGESDRAAAMLVSAAGSPARGPVSAVLAGSRWLVRQGAVPEAVRMLQALADRDPSDPRPALALKRLEQRGRKHLRIAPQDCKL